MSINTNSKPPVLAVVGPTASGKTALAVYLAKQLNGEVVSGDAFQVYREMSIGTAKPTPEEMQGIVHHLIDVLSVSESYSLGRYLEDAKAAISDIWGRGKLPVICGGTGLYISNLLNGTRLSETASCPEIREKLVAEAKEKGNGALHKKLVGVDPKLAKTLHPNNIGRIIRALEVYEVTGLTQSEHHTRSKPAEPPYDVCMIGLAAQNREYLYNRIDRRVDIMVQSGLVEEAQSLMTASWSREAAQAIGYKELMPYLNGTASLDDCISALKQATRRYAKRQLTWFRRDERIHWLAIDNLDSDRLCAQALQAALAHPFIAAFRHST